MSEDKKIGTENEDVENQGTEETGKSGGNESGEKSGSNGNGEGKTFTQEQVSRMMAREKNQGRNAVYNELGIDPKNQEQLKQVKAYLNSIKSDEDEGGKSQDDEKDKAITEAQQRAHVAEAKAEAMMLGVKKQFVEDVVILAMSKVTEDHDIKAVISEFKSKYPIWFGVDDDDKNNVGQKGTGSPVKPEGKGKEKSEKSMGARLAAQRKSGSNKKFSYWGNNN